MNEVMSTTDVTECPLGSRVLLVKLTRGVINTVFPYLTIYRVLVGKPEGKKPLGRPRL
jgi:hypothetical protein